MVVVRGKLDPKEKKSYNVGSVGGSGRGGGYRASEGAVLAPSARKLI